MSADRIAAVRLWAGTAVFGAFAAAAWSPLIRMLLEVARWKFFSDDSSGDFGGGGISANAIELSLPIVLALLGNVMVIGEVRRVARAAQLRRWHLVAWVALIVSAILVFLTPDSVSSWLFLAAVLLLPAQLTLLALVYAVLARARSRGAAAAAG